MQPPPLLEAAAAAAAAAVLAGMMRQGRPHNRLSPSLSVLGVLSLVGLVAILLHEVYMVTTLLLQPPTIDLPGLREPKPV